MYFSCWLLSSVDSCTLSLPRLLRGDVMKSCWALYRSRLASPRAIACGDSGFSRELGESILRGCGEVRTPLLGPALAAGDAAVEAGEAEDGRPITDLADHLAEPLCGTGSRFGNGSSVNVGVDTLPIVGKKTVSLAAASVATVAFAFGGDGVRMPVLAEKAKSDRYRRRSLRSAADSSPAMNFESRAFQQFTMSGAAVTSTLRGDGLNRALDRFGIALQRGVFLQVRYHQTSSRTQLHTCRTA